MFTEDVMNKQGFTLVEVLTTVLIIGVLASIAMPMYMRSIERARATEAMATIKSLNDATYAYFQDKEACPERLSQLVATLPSGTDTECPATDKTLACTKNFKFALGGAADPIPGTGGACMGVLATRIHGGSYNYWIWNPYTRCTSGKALALQCDAPEGNTKSIAVCESLGLYRESNT